MASTAPTTDEFRARFQEFRNVLEATLAAYLSDAATELHAETWGDLYSQGVMYLTASRLAATPYGQQAKLADGSGRSSYLTHYETLQRRVTVGVGRLAWAR